MDNIVHKYFDLSNKQRDQIESMVSIYEFWNKKVNLISRRDLLFFYERHILHSLSICKLLNFRANTKIMDLGTGGGFPGVPLAIMYPDVNFHLVDSINKKTKVLIDIAKELKLNNINVINARAEDINESYDFIVVRAVGRLDKLIKWTDNQLSTVQNNTILNGWLCLKGGDLTDEVSRIKHNISIYNISNFFEEDFFSTKKVIHVTK